MGQVCFERSVCEIVAKNIFNLRFKSVFYQNQQHPEVEMHKVLD